MSSPQATIKRVWCMECGKKMSETGVGPGYEDENDTCSACYKKLKKEFEEKEEEEDKNQSRETQKMIRALRARLVQLEIAIMIARHNHPRDLELDKKCKLLFDVDRIVPDFETITKTDND